MSAQVLANEAQAIGSNGRSQASPRSTTRSLATASSPLSGQQLSPPGAVVAAGAPTSVAQSRPRRSSSNNNNGTTVHTQQRSTSMNRQSRSRGYSNSSSSIISKSPYSPPTITAPGLHSNNDKRFTQNHLSPSSSSSDRSDALFANHFPSHQPSSNGTSVASQKSGIALTRRSAAAAAIANGAAARQNGNGNGASPDMASYGRKPLIDEADMPQDDEDEEDDQEAVLEQDYSSSPGIGKPYRRSTSSSASQNALGLGLGKKASLPPTSNGSSKVADDKLLRCERCHKVYHHPQSLIKHRWQHTEVWSDASKYGLSKHQTVQALEAAVILANPDTLRLLPNDKSHWPAAVSPPTSGLLGSEKLNIEILRKQAEVNERELADQERAGNLRTGPPNAAAAAFGTLGTGRAGMQTYSRSMPAQVGRRRSGLSFSIHHDHMINDEDNEDGENIDEASMATETNDEREDDGDNDDDDDSTESEDESALVGVAQGSLADPAAPTSEMESMDQDMFSLDISSSSPCARPQGLPPVAEMGAQAPARQGFVPTSKSGLSYSRRNYTTTSSIAPSADRYTFLPTIPSSSSLHLTDGVSGMSAIPTARRTGRNRSSSHTRSTAGYELNEERGLRENSASSSTDESGASAGASVGANTTAGSGDEAVSHTTKDSGYISTGQDIPKSEQHTPTEVQQQHQYHSTLGLQPVRPAIDPAQTAAVSMSAPVLGFFTERSPVSSFSGRAGAPSSRQHAGNSPSPVVGVPIVNSAIGNHGVQPISSYTPLEAQAAEILSSSHHSQQSFSGPRSFSQAHHGGSYARSPGFHPYRSPSPFPSSRQLPSSLRDREQIASVNVHSSSPSANAGGQAYSFGQAPLGSSFRAASFAPSSLANGSHTPHQTQQYPMSPLARPVDTADSLINEDEDDMMDMDL